MSHTDSRDWDDIKGLGPAKIAQIKAAIEVGRRFREVEIREETPKIKNALDVVGILMPRMRDLKVEVFKTVHLDSQNRVIDIVEESTGTVNFTTPIIREIFQKALQNFATSIICAHNHPSGVAIPSREDWEFTRKLKQAGEAIQVKVLDNVIIGNNNYISLLDESE